MVFEGVLNKMQSELAVPVQYYLVNNKGFVHVNQLIGQEITIEHTGYECLNCGKAKKIFRQGNCYDCFMTNASVGDWIMKPELSTAHLDIEDRDLEYEKKIQLQSHIVYLSFTGDLKVGVTRSSQIPTRWIDQGATQAISIMEVPNRYLAGKCEVLLKNYYKDKTDYRKMLANYNNSIDIALERTLVKQYLLKDKELYEYYMEHTPIEMNIKYPIALQNNKIKVLKLELNQKFKKKLVGIVGQYLFFEDGGVLNIRNHEGYKIFCII